jgi:hypothetical protein
MTAAFGECLCHAASVSLELQGHAPGVGMAASGDYAADFSVQWNRTSEQIKRTWNDDQDATEYGAYGIALLLADRFEGLTVVERAKKKTGFDYWLGPKSHDPAALFQGTTRLEVSGIANGGAPKVHERVQEKKEQVARYPNPLPALVIVVEFGNPQSRIVRG